MRYFLQANPLTVFFSPVAETSTAASAPPPIMLVMASNFGTVLATRLTHAVGDSMTLVTRSLIISNLFITTRMGGNLGAVTATVMLGTLIGSVISGAVPGYVSGFVIAGALAVLAIPIVMLAKPEF